MGIHSWDFAKKNYTRMEINASEMQMRETNLPQARADLRDRLLTLGLTLVVLLVLLFFLWRGLSNATPPSVEDQKADFTTYARQMMEDYKTSFLLGERSPEVLRSYKNWNETQLDTDDPKAAALKLLPGQEVSLWDWEQLKEREALRLFDAWYAEETSYLGDEYIAMQLSRSMREKQLPCLYENFWLAETADSTQYLLMRDGARWGVKPLEDFR